MIKSILPYFIQHLTSPQTLTVTGGNAMLNSDARFIPRANSSLVTDNDNPGAACTCCLQNATTPSSTCVGGSRSGCICDEIGVWSVIFTSATTAASARSAATVKTITATTTSIVLWCTWGLNVIGGAWSTNPTTPLPTII
jgi:hypothetical protein